MSLDFANVWLFDERSKIPVQRSSILCERSEFRSERSSGRTFAHGRPPERSLRNCERSKPGPGFESFLPGLACERSLQLARTFAANPNVRKGGRNERSGKRTFGPRYERSQELCERSEKSFYTGCSRAFTACLHLCFAPLLSYLPPSPFSPLPPPMPLAFTSLTAFSSGARPLRLDRRFRSPSP